MTNDELLKFDEPMGVLEILNKQAKEEGVALGMEKANKITVANMRKKGLSVETIANLMAMPEQKILAFFNQIDAESGEAE